MAASSILRSLPTLLRTRSQHHIRILSFLSPANAFCRRCSAVSGGDPSFTGDGLSSVNQIAGGLNLESQRESCLDLGGSIDWQHKILRDIQPITMLVKDILHSDRYRDGQRLSSEDQRVIVDRILAYHPQSEDKIGCGIDGIMVDRHPEFRSTRCLFVVRTDGQWEDFSYRRCIRAYIESKYPSHAQRFIEDYFESPGHFKRA